MSAAQRVVRDAITASGGEATAAVIAERIGIHVTTVRHHLDRLVAAGEVTADAAPSDVPGGPRRRGRPQVIYRIATLHPVQAVVDATRQLGFEPRIDTPWPGAGHDGVQRADLTLTNCPVRDAALANPEVVCGLHADLLQQVAVSAADRCGMAQPVVTLRPFAGDHGTCLLRLTQP